MIAARTLKSKEAIDDLTESGEDMEDIEIAASNAEKALNSIGLSARDSNGDFKDLEVILGEVAGKWDTLSNATKQYVSEQMAGNNRRSFFIGLMENYERVEELQTKAENSSGALMEASEKKANSLEGQLNRLQNAWYKMYEAMITSDTAKNIVGGLASILNVTTNLVGIISKNLIPVLGSATVAWIAYKVAMLEANGGFMTMGGLIMPLLGKITALKDGVIAASKAILASSTALTTLTGGLALLATGLIAYNHGVKLKEQMDEEYVSAQELSDAYSSLSDRMETLATVKERLANETNDLTSLEVLVAKMDSANTSLERRLDLQENINAQLKRYADEYPDLRGILLDENRSYEDRIEYLKQILELQKEEALNEAKKAVENGTMSDYGTSIKEKMVQMGASTLMKDDEAEEALRVQTLESAIMKQYNEAANRIETLKTLLADGAISQEYYQAELDGFKAITKELENNATFAKYFGKEVEESTGRIIEKTVNVKEAIASVFNKDYEVSSYSQALDDLRRAMEDTEGSAADSQEAVKSLSQVFPEMEGHITNLEEAVDYLANQAMLELASKADEVNTILTQMASEGFTGFDTSSAQELLKMYPELANHIQDTAYVQEFLNEKVRAYQDEINNIAENGSNAWGAYYDSVLAQDESFWDTKLKNSDQWVAYEKLKQDEMCKFGAKILGIEEQDFADYIDAKGGFRQVDYTNCRNAAQAEETLSNTLINELLGWFASYVTEKGGYRQTDMVNVAEFLNKQGVKEAKTVDDLKTMWADFYAAKKKAINAEIKSLNKKVDEMNQAGFKLDSQEGFEDMIMGTNGVSGAAKHHFSQLASQLTSVNRLDEDISNFFEAVDTTFGSIGSGLSQISATADKIGTNLTGGGSGFKPSSSSGGSGGSGSKPSGGSGGSGSGSGSERTVEDMKLEIDRYYTLQDAIENVNKALAKNQALQENVKTKAEYKKLIAEEIDLTNQKIKALENLKKEQEKERDELKASLKSNGFTFDGNNNITNYANRLKQLQNWANGITNPDQKEAAIAQVNAIKEMIDKYTELEDSTIPATTEEINGLKNEIISINKEFEENMKLIDALGDRYFDVLRKIAKVENEIALNQAKQDNANDYERIDLLGKEIELLLKRQQLVKEQRDESVKEANELKNQLVGKGVKFDNNGSIVNYKALVKSLEDKANGLVGDAQAEAVEDAQEVLDLIDKYVTLTEETLPNLETEWEKYTTQIQGSKDAIDEIFRSFKQTVTDVQKDIASAYEKYQTERYNKLQESLDKEIELYNKAYEEENFNRDLSKQQRELEEIAQQIAIYSRDTSEAGKARLEQLRKEYEEQQQAINDMIRDKEKDNASDRFDEVAESLDKELEDLLAPEKLVATVNDAIANGMITIGEETIKLDDLMTTWLNDTGDGLYALGDILKSELVENLEKAQDIIGKMNVNGFTMKAPTTTNDKLQAEIDKLKNTSVNGDMNFSLVVQGDVTKDSMPKLEKELQNMENRIYANIAKSLK